HNTAPADPARDAASPAGEAPIRDRRPFPAIRQEGIAMRTAVVFTAAVTLAAVLLASGPPPAHAADGAAPGGEVELLVCGPDTRPVAGAEVRVVAIHPLPHDAQGRREATGRTDGRGLVRFPWPAGVGRMRVAVPGVGYGATGLVEILPGRTSRAP